MIPVAAHIELNMIALHHNVRRVREYAPESKVMAVIKANAYGHGLIKIAQHLSLAVDALAVARLDEGIRLREAGVQGRILILQGFTEVDEIEALLHYQLDVVVHSEQQVQLLESIVLSGVVSVFLKIDTGMNRLGIRPEQFSVLLSRLQQCSCVHQAIVFMTHFANADDVYDAKTAQQLLVFNEVTGAYIGEKSVANSAAIIAWPETRFDWIRPGLMLYGVSPMLMDYTEPLDLLPVMSLYSRIIAIKQVKKGETVGYGASWIADKDTCLGVVSIGYGDGYPRQARQGTPVLINNKRMPLIGRVSMDMLTVDLSHGSKIQLGDQVVLWGDGLPVEEIAACAGTIPYTLLCGITRRVQVVVKEPLGEV
ncbi:MAG: alanine racemase [Methylococcaceae bacterium]|nr:alanine racemase [Methylococcaceae bacterium]